MSFFSIIIPVYKVEAYLHQCVNSVLAQDFEDFEIILVDDGSPDNCPQICDEYAAKDQRIKVIHKTNGGLSDARNAGIINAIGDYIIFLDSDDFWEGTIHLKKLAEIISINEGIDTVLFRCKHYINNKNVYVDRNREQPTSNMISDNDLKLLKMIRLGTQSSSACLRVTKRSILVENEIFFTKGIYGEDSDWFIHLSLFVKSSFEYPETFYIYRINRQGSITSNLKKKNFEDQIYTIDKWYNHLSIADYNINLTLALKGFLCYLYCVLILQLSRLPFDDYKNLISELGNRTYLLKDALNKKSKVIYWLNLLFGLKRTVYLVRNLYILIDKYRMFKK